MKSAHTFNRSFWVALGFAGVTLGMVACGGGGGGNGGGGSGGGGGSATTTTSSTTTSTSSTSTSTSTSTSSTSSSTSSGIPMNCTEITAGAFKKTDADGAAALYSAVPAPNLGDMTIEDVLGLELYGSEFDPSYDGEATGTFDLSMGGDANYSTCSRCLVIREDPTSSGVAKTYFPVAGSINIDATSDQLNGKIKATITDVTLVEVTIDSSTFESTPVAGGACLHLATGAIDVVPPTVPAAWMCDATYYADGQCDCGCGAFDDLDCADMTVASCKYCDDTGSCSTGTGCPGTIDPANNAICTPPP